MKPLKQWTHCKSEIFIRIEEPNEQMETQSSKYLPEKQDGHISVSLSSSHFQKNRQSTTSIYLLCHLYHLLLPIASHSPFSFSTQPSATIVTSTVIYQLRSTLIVSISSPKETEQCFHSKLGHLDLTIVISFFRSIWCSLLCSSGA